MNIEFDNIVFNDCHALARGCYGRIFKMADDKCLKILSADYPYDTEMFEIMKNLNLANFYKIYDLYYKTNGNLWGYTMKYYHNDETDILKMPTDYTLDNLMNLSKQIEEASIHKIFIRDLHSGNVIINKDLGIIVIDIDLYQLNNKMRLEQISNLNRENLSKLFFQIYCDALFHNHSKLYMNPDNFYALSEIFEENREPEMICKKLKKYKYPIDLMHKGKY